MSVTLRLYRLGKKNNPIYRIVAIDKRKKRNGTYNDVVGFYSPTANPPELTIDEKKFSSWKQKGATISEGLERLLKQKQFKKG